MLFSIVTILLCVLVSFPSVVLVDGWVMQTPQSMVGEMRTRSILDPSSRLFGEDKDVGGGGGSENLYSDFALPEDIPSPAVGESTVDWDAEWKKVVQKKGAIPRPGKDFYKSDAEIAAIVRVVFGCVCTV
jgi:hypothetical protein